MDETVLEPTREGALEEIQNCRERLVRFLTLYACVIGFISLAGYGNVLFFLVSGGPHARVSLVARIMSACLPLGVLLYGKKARFPGAFVRVYGIVEGIQFVLLIPVVASGFMFTDSPGSGAFSIFFLLLIGGALCGGPLYLLRQVGSAARRMLQIQKSLGEKGVEDPANGWMILLAVVCYLAPAYVPTLETVQRYRTIIDTEEVKCYDLGAHITYMASSPDGNLLALGTEKGLYVWDTRMRECVWSDDCLAVQRVRFSPGGRYLAAAGRGRPEGASDLAVYEVNGFRRLPGLDWPEHEEHKEKVFHDMAFRPNEETLLVLWHQSWVWNRMSQGWCSREAERIREREKSLGHETALADLLCTEVDVAGGAIGLPRTIRHGVSVSSELSPGGSAYFSSDASRFVYPTNNGQSISVFKWVHSVDTKTWEERMFQLDGYRLDMLWGLKHLYEWRLSANGTRAYLFCRKKINGENREVLIALDLETGEKQEWPVKGKWLALSPSEEQVAMLDGDTQDKKKTLIQLNLADMETGRETQVLRSFQKENRGAPRRFVWLKAQLFAVAMEYAQGAFVFIDLKEGEGK